ncbi:MAG TPA: FecR family protein [Steroidobacteraceae bacterium]|jgi:ferric-dicitrate binding protein FerR (iron transport regulator)|nr:FecR family protein [Steroidobacteraceae bacterium]
MSEIDPEKSDEAGIARVLRAAGGRANPSEDMKAAVRAAVHAEWRATVAKRRGRQRIGLAAAASVVIAITGFWLGRPFFAPPGDVVASVSRSIGEVQSREGGWGRWQTATSTQALRAGEEVVTGADGRVALQLRDGVSLRLDHDTRVAFVDAGRVDVRWGAVYVDAGTTAGTSEHLQVGTPAGVVRHVGTQYEARIVSRGTRIRVREGRIDLVPVGAGSQSASVGEQLLVSESGHIERGSIAPGDAEWNWAVSTAPAFDINGRPVREFLTWVGRELGREVVFATPESEAEADRAVLSGSVAGLAPAEALAAVLPTTRLRDVERDGKIEVSLQAGER